MCQNNCMFFLYFTKIYSWCDCQKHKISFALFFIKHLLAGTIRGFKTKMSTSILSRDEMMCLLGFDATVSLSRNPASENKEYVYK